jgi:hypothetical protein
MSWSAVLLVVLTCVLAAACMTAVGVFVYTIWKAIESNGRYKE